MTDTAPRYWTVVPDFEMAARMQAIAFERTSPTLSQPGFEEAANRDARWLDAVTAHPMATRLPPGDDPGWALRIAEPSFAPDFLPIGPNILSARLRSAMAIDDAVQWLPVDMAGSTDAAIAQDYRALRPLVSAPVLDIDAAGGEWAEHLGANGTAIRRWFPPLPDHRDSRGMTVRWMRDVVPGADLFLDSHMLWLLATDALKARVEAAGITDMRFMDYAIAEP